MSRKSGGHKAQRRGAAWESTITGELDRAMTAGTIAGFQQHGPLVQRVGSGGGRLIIVGRKGETGKQHVDFSVWGSSTWLFEAKATGQPRWSFSQLKQKQADKLSSWHAPAMGRLAGIALRFDTEPGHVALWLPWGLLRDRWASWAAGMAGRGDASLTIEAARDLGVPWGVGVFCV